MIPGWAQAQEKGKGQGGGEGGGETRKGSKRCQALTELCKVSTLHDHLAKGSKLPASAVVSHSLKSLKKQRSFSGGDVNAAQSCPTLCDPMDCGLPGSFVHGIFQSRVLEWVCECS